MTIIINTYKEHNLQEFLLDRLYSSQEIKQVKASNQAYYDAINRDKKAAQRAAEVAATPKQLSEAEYYEMKKKEDEARKAQQKAAEDERKLKELQHQEYLDSSPQRVTVCTNTFFQFIQEYSVWILKGYKVDESSISSAPSFYVAYLDKSKQ